MIIAVLANIKSVKRDEQLIVHHLDGAKAYNGPFTKVMSPFRSKEMRKATRLATHDYMLIKNQLDGSRRIEVGAKLVFMDAYEESAGAVGKVVLRNNQYGRFVDKLTGDEKIVRGPNSFAPGPWEELVDGIQQAHSINTDSAVIVLNKATGEEKLHSESGYFVPGPYEVVTKSVKKTIVISNVGVVVRNPFGRYTAYTGPAFFFVKPFEEMIEIEWSAYSQPPENGLQTISKQKMTDIDLREQQLHWQYDVRTSDNVALRIQGVVYWSVQDLQLLIAKTADPVGDIWYKCRSAVLNVAGRNELSVFRIDWRNLVRQALEEVRVDPDGFFSHRGVRFVRSELTKSDPIDEVIDTTLQDIIDETTKKVNRLQAQKNANEVKAAELKTSINLELDRKRLIEERSANERAIAKNAGEAKGVQQAEAARSFLDGLNTTIDDIGTRLELYNLEVALENQNMRTKHIADGKGTTLFLTPEDINLRINQNAEL